MFRKCWDFISSGSVYRQEGFNLLLSFIFGPSILLVLLLFGVEEDGTFKHPLVEFGVSFFSSLNGLYFVILCFIPMLALLLLKAWLFDAPNYKVFFLLIQFVSSIFYSVGYSVIIISSVVVIYGISFLSDVFVWGVGIILLGFGVFIMLLDFLPTEEPEAK